MNNILEISFDKEVDCSKEVAFWNYWDHEHLDVIHKGYKESDILYDSNNFIFRVDKVKIPVVPFLTSMSPIFTVQHDENTLLTYAIQFGVISKTTITINSVARSKCKINMNYKFYLNGWRKILRPILKWLIPIWNERAFLEDLPVKLRRQKIVDLNFKDFVGLPDRIDERFYSGEIRFKPPVKRPKNSRRDRHPLKK
jgi:hypothetical protein